MIAEKKIILFDGVCNMCNGIVNFIIRRDKEKKFMFGSLQSVEAQEMLNKYSIDKGNIDSIVLIVENEIFFESDAVLLILKNLGGIWNLFSVFKIVPKKFRDLLYKFIAVRRHKIFGRRNECMIPDENIRDRFI